MVTCVFAGHRQIFEPNIGEKVKKALEKLIETESRAVFLNGKWDGSTKCAPEQSAR